MARQIIIVSSEVTPDGYLGGTIVFWLTTPNTSLPYAPNPSPRSSVPDATPAELLALGNGTVTEKVFTGKILPQATTAQIQGQLILGYAQAQNELNALAPAKRYTTGTYDGVQWTNMPA